MMIKAILYSLTDVLVNSNDWHFESLNKALSTICQVEISHEDHLKIFKGLSTKTKLDWLQQNEVITKNEAKKILSLKQETLKHIIIERAVPYLEKIELHGFTKSRYIWSACVTNCTKETTILMLDRTWQLEHLQFVITNEEPKPSPKPYLLAMHRLQINPSETLIIENSDKGYESAVKSGAHVKRVSTCAEVSRINMEQWINIHS